MEEERTFSAMNQIKSLIRNRLQEDHLNCIVRPFVMRQFFPAADFPFNQAFKHWAEQCHRRTVLKKKRVDSIEEVEG